MDENNKGSFWTQSPQTTLQGVNSTQQGLSSEEVEKRIDRDGKNTFGDQKKKSPLGMLLRQFNSPITLILLFAVVVSLFLKDYTDAIIIFIIIFISGILSFYQEYNAGNAVEKLLSVVEVKTNVYRDGTVTQIPVGNLVVGDVLEFSAGDVIPADCYILSSSGLTLDESTLTGETFPVEKEVGVLKEETPLNERTNALWMGTHVVNGTATAVVVHTAKNTEFGKIEGRLDKKEPETDFEKGVREFGYLLMGITVALVLAIFLVNIALKKPVFDSFLFSMALAVGLTPQLLPAIISVNLSYGAKTMASKNVIVKKLSSIENFGSMSILCSDKTGTITAGAVTLHEAADVECRSSDDVFQMAYLNASFQSGYRNPIDEAIKGHQSLPLEGYEKLGEIPYNFIDKRLSVIVSTPADSSFKGQRVMITKGALDNVLKACDTLRKGDGSLEPLKNSLDSIQKAYEGYSSGGFRTLGIAYKIVEEDPAEAKDDALIFVGFLTLFDPLKEGIVDTVEELHGLGVQLKIITGDNRLIAKNIAQKLNLQGDLIVTGEDMNKMSETALIHKACETSIFAEIEPNQKERIILALKKTGNVVGYMGDGINDASAIHSADVGISVNNAADVAKDSASIVLMEQSLEVLVEGIKAGRHTFANTMKYVFMATSANFGNMFSMAGASLLLPFLPLLPNQVLVTNLLTDLPEMQIASDNVDEEMLERPKKWNIAFIKKYMLTFGLLSSIFDYLTFGVLLYFGEATESLFQTAWFTESILSASLIVLVIRTRKSFIKSKPGKGLLLATVGVVILTLLIPYTPVASLLKLVPLPPKIYGMIAGIVVVYIAAAETVKKIFYKHVKD